MFNPLTVCIINYNGEKYLHETLSSVCDQRNSFNEIILIDNASEDKSIEIVKKCFPDIRIIPLDKNYGPALARNQGFKESSSDEILFLDNDVVLAPGFIENLLKALESNPGTAAAMPQVYFADQQQRIQYNGADSHFLGLMSLEQSEHPANKVRKIGSIVTACFWVDRKHWREENPFDDSFFFNYEDHDFGIRTRIKGLEIISITSAHCFHKEGTQGLSRREGLSYSKKRVYYLVRNRWQIILKNYELKTIIILFPILMIYELIQLIAVIKKGWFKPWFDAVQWIFKNSKSILHKRRHVQMFRKTPDREILKGGPLPFFKDLPSSKMEIMGKKILDALTGRYWMYIKPFIR